MDVDGWLPSDLAERGVCFYTNYILSFKWWFRYSWFQWNIVVLKVDDVEAFPNYPYRDDALLIFEAIQTYVREALEAFYGENWKLSVNELLWSIWHSWLSYLVHSTQDHGPGWGHCVVFLGKTLYSHSASHLPGV